MASQWFAKDGAWQDGPFSLDRLRELVVTGQCGPQTQVRRADETSWRAIAELAGVNLQLPTSGLAGTTEIVSDGFKRAVLSAPGPATTHAADRNDPLPPPVCVPPPRLAEVAVPETPVRTAWLIFLWVPAVAALSVVAVVAILIATQWSRERTERYREARAAEMAALVAEVESHVEEKNVAAARESLRNLEQALGPDASTGPWPARTQQLALQIEKCERHVAARDLWQRGVQASESDEPESAIDLLTKCLDLGDEEFLEGATKLRAECELAVSKESASAEVATWTDAQIADVLAGGTLPNPPPIASAPLLARYDGLLRTFAVAESDRRDAEKRVQAAQLKAKALADAERLRLAALDRERERVERAEEEALIAAQLAREAAEADWRADKDAHGMLRLIPADALWAMAAPNAQALGERVGPVKPAEFYSRYYSPHLFAEGTGFDPMQPAASVWAVPGKADAEEPSLVLIYATNDLAKACKPFKLDVRAIRAGEVSGFGEAGGATLRDKYLFLGDDRDVVVRVADSYAKGESLATQMTAAEGRALLKRDVVTYVGPRAWSMYRAVYGEALESSLDAGVKDPEARKFWDACLAAYGQVRMGVVGVDLKKDLEIQAVATFNDHAEAEVSGLLKLLNAGSEPPDLAHLPRDHALWAFAARGDGASNATVARALFNFHWNNFAGTDFLPEDYQAIAEPWGEAWRNVRSVRAACYHTGFGGEAGTHAYVALLDCDDPAAFVEAVRPLVDRANAAATRSGAGLKWTVVEEELFGRRAYAVTDEIGGDRNTLRIVPCKGKVVLFIGSKLDLLQETLQNVDESLPGLAEHDALQDSLKSLDPERKLQFSISAAGLLGAAREGPLLASPEEYSSASLTLSPEQIKLDLIVPIAELGFMRPDFLFSAIDFRFKGVLFQH